MSNLYPSLSNLNQKRQAFRIQIRSKHRQEYFIKQRKLLLQGLYMTTLSTNNNINVVLNSMKQIEEHLNNHYLPNYAAINQYLQNHHEEHLPQHILSLIMSHSTKPQFMKNQHALVLLIKVFNSKQFNSEYWLTEQTVANYVEKVIKQNTVLEDPHHKIYRLDYFNTVCWFLVVIGQMAKDKILTASLKQHLKMMQEQAYHQLPFEFIFLLSQLSVSPQFMPSQQFIIHLLTYEPLQSQSTNYLTQLVNLLDNYLRYRCQKQFRFDEQESYQLMVEYLKFINKKIKNLKFPGKLKISLINLIITIVNSVEVKLVMQLFNIPQSQQLCQQLFYRAEYAQWQAKLASFQCFTGILLVKQLLPKVLQFIDPAKIVYLYVNSMTLPDRYFQMNAIACIHFLLLQQNELFKQYFKHSEYLSHIRFLEISDQKHIQNSGEQISLAQFARLIDQQYLQKQVNK